ncbi:TPA: DUF4365 domain-containing protein [Providencia stuartii]|nr:DUF4365 domain-containing protein [Providencia stuartii]
MHISNKKEEFQIAYVSALAANMGYNTSKKQVDNDSVDISFHAYNFSEESEIMNPTVDFQLKATSSLNAKSGFITFSLKKKNYNDLSNAKSLSPKYLLLLHLPENEDEWIEELGCGIYLKNKCYWYSLKGLPPSNNKTTVNINIPESQVLTLEVLKMMMTEASNRRSLA